MTPSRSLFTVLPVVAALFLLPSRVCIAETTRDPIDDLRAVLLEPLGPAPTAVTAKARASKLDAALKKITSPGDLCRAVVLQEWGYLPSSDSQGAKTLIAKREEGRKGLAKRMLASIREVLAKPDAPRRLAILALVEKILEEQEQRNRAQQPQDGVVTQAFVFSDMVTDVAGLLKSDSEPPIRIAALRTFVKMRPNPRDIAPFVKQGLAAKSFAERRATARIALSVIDPSGFSRVNPSLPLYAAFGEHLLPLVERGTADEDAMVRRLCLGAIGMFASDIQGAMILSQSMPQPGDDPAELIAIHHEGKPIVLLLQALNRSLPRATKALADGDLMVCLAAHKMIEDAATVRWQWRRGYARYSPGKPEWKDAIEAPVKAVPALVVSLKRKELRVRLAALYVLETLTVDAVPAADAVAAALKDENRFVRWAAARTLRNMAPAGAAKAVPALAAVLADESADVRNTAAVALARFGPAAKDAVDALAKAVKNGDAKLRLRAASALGAVGKEAKEAVPVLAAALADEQADVREAAAKALGRVGALDGKTRAVLVKALDDPDSSVQIAAAAALLAE